MALTFKQRRRRGILIGVIAAVLIISFTMGRSLVSQFFGPAGYAMRAPKGNFTKLDWAQLKQVQEKGGKILPAAQIAALDGQPVSVRGYIIPLNEDPLSEQKTARPLISEAPCEDLHCAQPNPNEVVLARIAGEKRLQLVNLPVRVFGTLRVGAGDAGSALYIIENATLVTD